MSTPKLIKTYDLGSPATAIDFTSIPPTYDSLLLFASLRNTDSGATYAGLKVNGDGGFDYSFIEMQTDTASVSQGASGSVGPSNTFCIPSDTYTANVFSSLRILISGYTLAQPKPMLIEAIAENNGSGFIQSWSSFWAVNTAINQLTLLCYSSFSFKQYSSASLYGIKNT